MNTEFESYVDLSDDLSLEVTVEVSGFSPGYKGSRLGLNGEGWPEESPEVEVTVYDDGEDITSKVSEEDIRRLEEEALEKISDDATAAAEDAAFEYYEDYCNGYL